MKALLRAGGCHADLAWHWAAVGRGRPATVCMCQRGWLYMACASPASLPLVLWRCHLPAANGNASSWQIAAPPSCPVLLQLHFANATPCLPAGLSVSQVIPLAVYEGVADPPQNLAPLTATSTTTTVPSPPAATASNRRSPPSKTAIIAIGASVGSALAFTGEVSWLGRQAGSGAGGRGSRTL